VVGEGEDDELADKVGELQDAPYLEQGAQDDTLSRTSSKVAYAGSLRSKVGQSPLSQAGSSLTKLS
jgi:hypothetical protein